MGYRVYQYGCRPPTSGEAEAVEQMFRRNRFWNALVEIEQLHQASVERVISETEPNLGGLLAAAQADGGKPAWDAYRKLRKAAFAEPAVKDKLGELDAERKERVKAAQAASELYWCNYDDVVASYQTARRRPGDLRFHAWARARGKVSVRYQTGLPVAGAFGDDTRFQLQPVPETAYTSPVRGERRRLARSVARIRIGSDERRAPIWLELPVVLHRAIPAGSMVRSVSVTRERIGANWPEGRVGSAWRWQLNVCVSVPDADPRSGARGSVALDVGWRRVPDGLRVAAWRNQQGQAGELVLPQRWIDQMARVDDLRSLRDQHFNLARAALAGWLKDQGEVPDWLKLRAATLRQWRSPARLASMFLTWRSERFGGDSGAFPALEAWWQRDRHLYQYEANLRDQLQTERRERYRVFSAGLMARYDEIRLEQFDLRNVADLSREAKDLALPARHQRVLASVSILRLAIEHAALREGVTVTKLPAARTTATCHGCGSLERFDQAAELVHRCGACGLVWDQDDNAAINLLAQTAEAQ